MTKNDRATRNKLPCYAPRNEHEVHLFDGLANKFDLDDRYLVKARSGLLKLYCWYHIKWANELFWDPEPGSAHPTDLPKRYRHDCPLCQLTEEKVNLDPEIEITPEPSKSEGKEFPPAKFKPRKWEGCAWELARWKRCVGLPKL